MGQYSVEYNGVTSFVPPCFCWDVTDLHSGQRLVASELDLTRLTASGHGCGLAENDFREQRHVVEGELMPSGPHPGSGQEGLTLMITDVLA